MTQQPRCSRPLTILVLLIGVVGSLLIAVTEAAPAAANPTTNAATAVNYARTHGYRSSIAVQDTAVGTFWGSGDYNSAYASESVMKVFIATRLLLTGQMTGWNNTTAFKMITQSDDASANALYGRTGGDGVITWVKQTLRIPNLGSPPLRSGWWGSTQITASGMAQFYNAVKHQPKVWPWLSYAMHHATRNGSDGFYQYFGIPSATSGAAIKQGWGGDNAAGQPALNSTGYVNGDRYAVVILVQGGVYGAPISNMVTSIARMLMPGGKIANDDPLGRVDHATVLGNRLSMVGWTWDTNARSTSLKMAVYSNGHFVTSGTAALPRPDVNRAYGITGQHGFRFDLTLPNGRSTVCAYAINVGAGVNTNMGCVTANVSGQPLGHLDPIVVRGNVAAVRGWSWDYNTPTEPVQIRVYRNGGYAGAVTTAVARPDVNARYGLTGNHGFSTSVVLPSGRSTLCAYAMNRPNGPSQTLGCQTVGLDPRPTGSVDVVTVADGQATLAGWTFDFDDPNASIKVAIYVNRHGTTVVATTQPRPDVNTAYGITGSHGYRATVPVPAGQSSICVYGLSIGAGANQLLGCRSVTRP